VKKYFPEFVVDILHSKMKKEEKEEVMQDFLDKKSQILVATSVVEVGVNVPNATVMSLSMRIVSAWPSFTSFADVSDAQSISRTAISLPKVKGKDAKKIEESCRSKKRL
jgi:late competence protein required for DNA uptake (superfamily II DNA/RNA helicase)